MSDGSERVASVLKFSRRNLRGTHSKTDYLNEGCTTDGIPLHWTQWFVICTWAKLLSFTSLKARLVQCICRCCVLKIASQRNVWIEPYLPQQGVVLVYSSWEEPSQKTLLHVVSSFKRSSCKLVNLLVLPSVSLWWVVKKCERCFEEASAINEASSHKKLL